MAGVQCFPGGHLDGEGHERGFAQRFGLLDSVRARVATLSDKQGPRHDGPWLVDEPPISGPDRASPRTSLEALASTHRRKKQGSEGLDRPETLVRSQQPCKITGSHNMQETSFRSLGVCTEEVQNVNAETTSLQHQDMGAQVIVSKTAVMPAPLARMSEGSQTSAVSRVPLSQHPESGLITVGNRGMAPSQPVEVPVEAYQRHPARSTAEGHGADRAPRNEQPSAELTLYPVSGIGWSISVTSGKPPLSRAQKLRLHKWTFMEGKTGSHPRARTMKLQKGQHGKSDATKAGQKQPAGSRTERQDRAAAAQTMSVPGNVLLEASDGHVALHTKQVSPERLSLEDALKLAQGMQQMQGICPLDHDIAEAGELALAGWGASAGANALSSKEGGATEDIYPTRPASRAAVLASCDALCVVAASQAEGCGPGTGTPSQQRETHTNRARSTGDQGAQHVVVTSPSVAEKFRLRLSAALVGNTDVVGMACSAETPPVFEGAVSSKIPEHGRSSDRHHMRDSALLGSPGHRGIQLGRAATDSALEGEQALGQWRTPRNGDAEDGGGWDPSLKLAKPRAADHPGKAEPGTIAAKGTARQTSDDKAQQASPPATEPAFSCARSATFMDLQLRSKPQPPCATVTDNAVDSGKIRR
jgi:hypothetical protein